MNNLPKVFKRDKSHNRLLPKEYGYWGVEVAEDGLTFLGYQDETEHVAFSELANLPEESKTISVIDTYVSFGDNDDFRIMISGKQNAMLDTLDKMESTLLSAAGTDDEGYYITQLNLPWKWVFSGVSAEPQTIENIGGFVRVAFPVKGGDGFELFGLKDNEFEKLKSSARAGQYELPNDSDERNWEFFNLNLTPKLHEVSIKFSKVSFQLKNGDPIILTGLAHNEVRQLLSCLQSVQNNLRTHMATVQDLLPEIQSLGEVITRLENPRRYPAACLVETYLEQAQMLSAKLPSDVPNSLNEKILIDKIRRFANSPHELRDESVKRFIECELAEHKKFFDTIEAKPLTSKQRHAVITDEDATLILAGAGSGKTSVIVAKVAYLIEKCRVTPSEILVLAFNRAAATEMAGRIQRSVGKRCRGIIVSTFHSFGREVIVKVTGRGPETAPWVGEGTSYNVKFRNHLRGIVEELRKDNRQIDELIRKYFSGSYKPYKIELNFDTWQAYEAYIDSQGDLLTLRGETVRSYQEFKIANWLTMNGINYDYERRYPEHLLPDSWRGRYEPDFYLTEYDVYFEHFGVNRDGQTGRDDSTDYRKEMEDKINLHKKNGTHLIKTYSDEINESNWRVVLEQKLGVHGVKPNPISEEKVLDMLKQLKAKGTVDTFTETLRRFLVQFKGMRIKGEDLRPDGGRSEAFLKLFESVYRAYQKDLEDRKCIDFSDMIVQATDYAEEGAYKSPFKYILVDEFQDISSGLAQLLKALKAQNSKSRLFAVGDDWQSINRFSGTDIRLMREFGHEFGGKFAEKHDVNSTIDLGATFRFGDGIAQPAREFILKNVSQIPKDVSTTPKPSKIMIVNTCCLDFQVGKILHNLNKQAQASGKKTSLFFLYRNKYQILPKLDNPEEGYPNLLTKFMNVHQSKGLEADHVIILGLGSGKYGFPSEVMDDPVLGMVLPKQENFKHAEERRLFYVALTRAKRSVTIFADKRKPSTFVDELLNNPVCDFNPLCEHLTKTHFSVAQ